MYKIQPSQTNVNEKIIHTHEDFRCVYESHTLRTKYIHHTTSELLHRIIDLSIINLGKYFVVQRGYFAQKLGRCEKTISRHYKILENNRFITIHRKFDNITMKTHNYIQVNYVELFNYYGNELFKDRMPRAIKFMRNFIEKFKSLCGTLCLTNKPSSNEEDIYIYKENDMKKEGLEGKTPLKQNPLPIEELIDPDDPRNRTYFDRSAICDAKHIEIALKLGLKEELIFNEFSDYRSYWIGLGKIKTAKKSDWLSTWRNRVDFLVNKYPWKKESNMKLKLEEPIYPWTKNTPIPVDWGIFLKQHGFLEEYLPDIYANFSSWYSCPYKDIRRTKIQWKTLWESWLQKGSERADADKYMRPRKSGYSSAYKVSTSQEEKPIDNFVLPSNPSIYDKIRVLAGEGVYKSYIQEGSTLTESKQYPGKYELIFSANFMKQSFMNKHGGQAICEKLGIFVY